MEPKQMNSIGGTPFSWTCPYCERSTTVNHQDYTQLYGYVGVKNVEDFRKVELHFVICPNKDCKRTTIMAELFISSKPDSGVTDGELTRTFLLLPESTAKTFPTYIPAPLRQDYQEACAILRFSPKASATLSRRCLQGIIRNFWNISKARLIDEINELKSVPGIDPLVIQAIDAVRVVGNIGAHMEKDINLIVDVDEGEADLLLSLIETLFKECYVHRHEREENLKKIAALTAQKQAQKKAP